MLLPPFLEWWMEDAYLFLPTIWNQFQWLSKQVRGTLWYSHEPRHRFSPSQEWTLRGLSPFDLLFRHITLINYSINSNHLPLPNANYYPADSREIINYVFISSVQHLSKHLTMVNPFNSPNHNFPSRVKKRERCQMHLVWQGKVWGYRSRNKRAVYGIQDEGHNSRGRNT